MAEVSCKICFESFNLSERRPKILSNCGHTFCLHCVTEFTQSGRGICPVCRQHFYQYPSDMKDNYELIEVSTTMSLLNKNTRFWCINCLTVASNECVEEHSVRKLDRVVSEKAERIKEKLQIKFSEEKRMLQEVLDSLNSVVKAVQVSVLDRLLFESDLCAKRMQEINQYSVDIDSALKIVLSNGDLGRFDVFDKLNNQQECSFLSEVLERQSEMLKCKLTVSLPSVERVFTFGHSCEDQVLGYLLSILETSMKTPHSKVISSDKLAPITTNWKPSPWLTKWGQTWNDSNADVSSDSESGWSTDDESILPDLYKENTTEAVTTKILHREVYVNGISSAYSSQAELRRVFSYYGNVTRVKIHNSRQRGRKSSIAFIQFETEDAVTKVLNNKKVFQEDFGFVVKHRLIQTKHQKIGLKEPSMQDQNVVDQQDLAGPNHSLTQKLQDFEGEFDTGDSIAQRMLFIQRVPVDFPEHRISEILSKYGPVQDVKIQEKNIPGMSPRAFGFVTFVNKSSAKAALRERNKRICYSGPDYNGKVVLEYRAYFDRPLANDHKTNHKLDHRGNVEIRNSRVSGLSSDTTSEHKGGLLPHPTSIPHSMSSASCKSSVTHTGNKGGLLSHPTSIPHSISSASLNGTVTPASASQAGDSAVMSSTASGFKIPTSTKTSARFIPQPGVQAAVSLATASVRYDTAPVSTSPSTMTGSRVSCSTVTSVPDSSRPHSSMNAAMRPQPLQPSVKLNSGPLNSLNSSYFKQLPKPPQHVPTLSQTQVSSLTVSKNIPGHSNASRSLSSPKHTLNPIRSQSHGIGNSREQLMEPSAPPALRHTGMPLGQQNNSRQSSGTGKPKGSNGDCSMQ